MVVVDLSTSFESSFNNDTLVHPCIVRRLGPSSRRIVKRRLKPHRVQCRLQHHAGPVKQAASRIGFLNASGGRTRLPSDTWRYLNVIQKANPGCGRKGAKIGGGTQGQIKEALERKINC